MTFLRKSFVLVTAISFATACGDSKDEPTDDTDTTDTTDTTSTQSTLESFFPENGATDVFYKTPIEIVFGQDEATTATITVTSGGTAVAGTTTFSSDGETAYFAPTADLMPSTTYEVAVAFSGGKNASATWTTSDTGAAVDGNTLIGNIYSIDIFSGRITEPAGVGDLLGSLLGDTPINVLISPSELNGTELTMRGALGNEDFSQDVCSESIDFPVPADYSSSPYFTIEGLNVPISVQGITLTIDTLNVSGAFSPNGDAIEGAAITASLDSRKLSGLDIGDICELVVIAGISCTPCSDGTAACLDVKVDSLVAAKVGTGGITPVDLAAVEANPDCVAAP